jgi:hypothetical protein
LRERPARSFAPFDQHALDKSVDVFVLSARRKGADSASDTDRLEGRGDLPVFSVNEQSGCAQGSGMGDATPDIVRNQPRMGDGSA